MDKPRRKRGRPPKSAAPIEEKPIENFTKSEGIVKKEISEEEDDQETDGRRRRRRKVPSRYREAVQVLYFRNLKFLLKIVIIIQK